MAVETTDWRHRAPGMLLRPGLCSHRHLDETDMDRRWLWLLEAALAVEAPTGSDLAQVAYDLKQYLHETCEHHWHGFDADAYLPAHRQCLYCNHVEWGEAV